MVKNSSKHMANLWEYIPISLGMIYGTLNPPMCGKHFAQIYSNGSMHFDQKGGSLTVKNRSKYLANLWELIPIDLGMIYCKLNPPMFDKYFAQTPSYGSKHLDQIGGSLTVKNSSKYVANHWELIPIDLGMI